MQSAGGRPMARDSFTEVTRTSWFSRVKSSFAGVLVGLLLVVVAVAVLFWNEGRAVTTARSLAEGKGLVVSVDAGNPDPANEGRLVHLSGAMTLPGPVRDPVLGVTADAIRIHRKVEMYQWVEEKTSETRTTTGGGQETTTRYDYKREWRTGRVDSSQFREREGHENPPLPIAGETFSVEEAKVGAFSVDRGVLDQVGSEKDLAVPRDLEATIAAALDGTRPVIVADGVVSVARTPDRPLVGDLRISYRQVPPVAISAVGRQQGGALVPYQTESGDALLMAEDGRVPADVMFAKAESANTVLTWIVRVAGLLVLFIGFSLVTGPLGTIADVIPFLGSIVRFGTGLIAGILTALVGPLTIAIAWFWYRPLIALAVIAAGVVVTVLLSRLGRRRAAGAPGTVGV